jgi:hypothetical protein
MVIDGQFNQQLSTTSSDEFDLYEPVCLDSSIDQSCPNEFLFERIPHMTLGTDSKELLSFIRGLDGF